jgi:hypothetical protein
MLLSERIVVSTIFSIPIYIGITYDYLEVRRYNGLQDVGKRGQLERCWQKELILKKRMNTVRRHY